MLENIKRFWNLGVILRLFAPGELQNCPFEGVLRKLFRLEHNEYEILNEKIKNKYFTTPRIWSFFAVVDFFSESVPVATCFKSDPL